MSAVNDPAPRQAHRRLIALAAIAVIVVAASLVAAPGLPGLFGAALGLTMIAIADHDARLFIIPDYLTALAFGLGIVFFGSASSDAGWPALSDGLLRAALTFGVFWSVRVGYRQWRGRDGLGFGDVKLAAVLGLWLDALTIVGAIEIAALAAILFVVTISRVNRRPLSAAIRLPFGLFLAPAIWLGWLYDTIAASRAMF